MAAERIIMLSKDSNLISEFDEVAKVLNVFLEVKFDFTNLLLGLQENDYCIAVIDCTLQNNECLNWVKIVRRLRPKVPIIVTIDEVKKEYGARLYEENIYYMFLTPINKSLLKEILNTILSQLKVKIHINKIV